jgi:hypothetical protein
MVHGMAVGNTLLPSCSLLVQPKLLTAGNVVVRSRSWHLWSNLSQPEKRSLLKSASHCC